MAVPAHAGWAGPLLAILTAAAPAAEPAPALVIGQPQSVIREHLPLRLVQGTQTVALAGLPSGLDASSLKVRLSDPDARVDGWQVRPFRAPALAERGGDVVWRPAGAATVESARVELAITASQAGVVEAELVYLATGLTWAADYLAVVRGDLSNEEERVSLDLRARVRIGNQSGRGFPPAAIWLADEGRTRPADQPVARAGFLLLEDDPLADLWRNPEPSTSAPRLLFRLPAPVQVPARGSVDVDWINLQRQPAERIYRLEGTEGARSGPGGATPLNRWLEMELAGPLERTALPAGPASVFLGSARGTPLRAGWVGHTPAGGRMRLDLGPADGVTGERRALGRSAKVAGGYEDARAVILVNRLTSPVRVEVVERPPVALEWELVRSSVPATRAGHQLQLATRLEAGQTLTIRYELRIREPDL